ncbi:hypothetical protein ACFP81_11185 [Deinococcus lacus]|uniref:Uncharacterized protein n=1 Tax=Deinococcus lacus TaxID=392561 RepID=A0ABW1YEQ4_9DEIO
MDLGRELRLGPLDHIAVAAHSLDEGSQPYLALGFSLAGQRTLPSHGVSVRMLCGGHPD